ncbi:hypothetical protein Tsubulata_016025, partial [Turnera subulata]
EFEMQSLKYCLVILILIMHQSVNVETVQVHVHNLLEGGKNMTIHCQSKDRDLGYATLGFDQQLKWSFFDIFGTTLYVCSAKWADSDWNQFDAYDAGRDYFRCFTQCRWRICGGQTLLGYNQLTGIWELFPFSTTSFKGRGMNVVEAETLASVQNLLQTGENMTIHCQSKDRDLGYVNLEYGQQLEWHFRDILGFTTYWCYVIWDSSPGWNYFEPYFGLFDYFKCWTECRWRIYGKERLLGYNQILGRWELLSFMEPYYNNSAPAGILH